MEQHFMDSDIFGGHFDSLNSEPPDSGKINPTGAVLPNAQSGENPGEPAKSRREEEIENAMRNIKEFIRGIDVTSL